MQGPKTSTLLVTTRSLDITVSRSSSRPLWDIAMSLGTCKKKAPDALCSAKLGAVVCRLWQGSIRSQLGGLTACFPLIYDHVAMMMLTYGGVIMTMLP
eukprot:1157302-Pelagomonas_calceolata.AAC.15